MNSITSKFFGTTRRYASTVAMFMAMGVCVAGASAADAVSFSTVSAMNAIGNASTVGGFTVGGGVSGLFGSGLVLQLNGGGDLPLTADGSFEFVALLTDGSPYVVTVETQPASPAQICTATNASGTIAGANVTDVNITCVTDSDDRIFVDGFDGLAGGMCEPAQLLADTSFDASLGGSGPWTSTSTNFGSVFCTIADCTDGDGEAGPHTSDVWAWFGGAADGTTEESTAVQSLVIPAGSERYLNFWLWIAHVGDGSSILDVTIDGTLVTTFLEPVEPELGYTQRSLDISTYADGASHTVEFHYSQSAPLSSTFNLDDVTIDCTGVPAVRSMPAPNTPEGSGLFRTH